MLAEGLTELVAMNVLVGRLIEMVLDMVGGLNVRFGMVRMLDGFTVTYFLLYLLFSRSSSLSLLLLQMLVHLLDFHIR